MSLGALIVSADQEQIKFVKNILRDLEMPVFGVYQTAKQAVEAYKDASSELVIIDSFIPGTTGFELLANLKRMNDSGSFLFLNRLRTRSALEKTLRLGVQDSLHYPVEAQVLKDSILRRKTIIAETEGEEARIAAAASQATPAKPPQSKK